MRSFLLLLLCLHGIDLLGQLAYVEDTFPFDEMEYIDDWTIRRTHTDTVWIQITTQMEGKADQLQMKTFTFNEDGKLASELRENGTPRRIYHYNPAGFLIRVEDNFIYQNVLDGVWVSEVIYNQCVYYHKRGYKGEVVFDQNNCITKWSYEFMDYKENEPFSAQLLKSVTMSDSQGSLKVYAYRYSHRK